MIRDQFIKPSAKRIGNDIILTRQDPIEEMIATIGPFSAITAGLNCTFAGSMAFAQSPAKIFTEKHSPLYSFYNGGTGELTINLDKDLMNAVSSVIPLDTNPKGRLAHIGYRMFSKLELEVETNDV